MIFVSNSKTFVHLTSLPENLKLKLVFHKTWDTEDSQGQMQALAVWSKSLNPVELSPPHSEAALTFGLFT